MKTKNWRKKAIAIIWSLNILLLTCEHYQIKNLKRLEYKLNSIIETKLIVTRNKKLGNEVLRASSALYTTSEEPLLGWLEIENNLVTTAEKCGLKNIMISSPSEFTGSDDALTLQPVNMSFVGKYSDALKWVNTVENKFLYVDILKISVTGSSSDGTNSGEMYALILQARLKKITTAHNKGDAERKGLM